MAIIIGCPCRMFSRAVARILEGGGHWHGSCPFISGTADSKNSVHSASGVVC